MRPEDGQCCTMQLLSGILSVLLSCLVPNPSGPPKPQPSSGHLKFGNNKEVRRVQTVVYDNPNPLRIYHTSFIQIFII